MWSTTPSGSRTFWCAAASPRLVAVVVSLAALGLAAWLSPPAALVMAAALAVTGFVVPRIAARSNRRAREVEESTEFAVGLDQVLQHRVEFAAAGRAEGLIGEVAEASQRVTREKLAAQRSTVAAEAIQTVATGAAALGVAAIAVATYSGNPTWLGMLLMLSLAAFESQGPLPAAARHADDAARRIAPEQPAEHATRRCLWTRGVRHRRGARPAHHLRRYGVESPRGARRAPARARALGLRQDHDAGNDRGVGACRLGRSDRPGKNQVLRGGRVGVFNLGAREPARGYARA